MNTIIEYSTIQHSIGDQYCCGDGAGDGDVLDSPVKCGSLFCGIVNTNETTL
jgi:hypothetical protein